MDNIQFPNSFFKGDSVSCEDYFEDFKPSDGWIASYIFLNGANKIVVDGLKVVANIDTNTYVVNLLSIDTLDYFAGNFTFSIVFSNTNLGKRLTKTIKSVVIKEDVLTASTLDNRFWAEIALENAQAVLQNKASMTQKSYEIAGRKLENFPLSELIQAINWLKGQITQENNRNGNFNNNIIKVQFKKAR